MHVYGVTSDALRAWCAVSQSNTVSGSCRSAHQAAGLARNGFYLLRPDTYVALAEKSADPKVMERYFEERKIAL
ncbi:hypothetical protein [Pseudomonas chlororaphis]|uniref:hypothetical protein n=1 Tax=Pseudomonas chlororaphis TaxID=587753 RepID=UPI003D0E2F62